MTTRTATPQEPTFRSRPVAEAVRACLRHRPASHIASAAGLSLLLACPATALADTYTVTNTNDAGAGSLRQAVLDANANPGADEVLIASSVSGSISLTSGRITVTNDVSIQGPGVDVLVVDGDIISITGDGIDAKISDLALEGIEVQATSTLWPEWVAPVAVVRRCQIGERGVAVTAASVTVQESTITGSSVSGNAILDCETYSYMFSCVELGSSLSIQDSNLVDASVSTHTFHYAGSLGIEGSTVYRTNVIANSCDISESVITGGGEFNVWCGPSMNIAASSITGIGGIRAFGAYEWRGSLSITGSKISGNASGPSFWAPGYNPGSVAITDSTISNNGSGLEVEGAAYTSIVNSTISGNEGTGVVSTDYYNRDMLIVDSTITNNDTGVWMWTYHDWPQSVKNSIISGNSGGDFYGEAYADFNLIGDAADANLVETIPGSNLFGVDPLLGPLQDNGGPTETHALLSGSPAIDRGNPDFTPPPDYDQRGEGYPRVVNGRIDMGAFEVQDGVPPVEPPGAAWLGSLGDTNGDGMPDIAVVTRSDGQNLAIIKDVASGSLVSQFEFSADLSPVDVEVMDLFGWGYGYHSRLAPNLVLLGTNGEAETRDALTGDLLGRVAFNPKFAPVDLNVLPDEDGNGVPEVGMLGKGSTRVEILDAVTGDPVNNLWFAGSFEPSQVITLPDLNGNGSAEVGALITKADETDRVVIHDSLTDEAINTVAAWWYGEYDLLQALPVTDEDGNATGKVALLLHEAATGKTLVRITDAATDSIQATLRGYNPDFDPVKLVEVADMNGNGAEEYAVLARNPDTGQVHAKIRDGVSNEAINTVWFDKTCTPLDLVSIADINANGAQELVLLERCADGELYAVVKDAGTGERLNIMRF